MRRRILSIVILIAVFMLLGGLSFAVSMYFDYLWFQELGKTAIFTTSIYAKSLLGGGVLILGFLFLYINLIFANSGPGLIEIGIPTPTGQITAYRVTPEMVQRFSGLFALVIGFFSGIGEANNWEKVWRWLHRVDFGAVDPVFSKDISFYFFTLPFLKEIVRLGLILSLLAVVSILVLYYFKGTLAWRKRENAGRRNRTTIHVSILASVIFIILAIKAYLDRYEILFGSHEIFSGANYSELYGRLPVLTILAVAALVGALLWVFNAFASNNRAGAGAVILYFAVLFIGNLYPAFLQKFIVSPNEMEKESAQITHNIRATLQAYELSEVEERDLSGDKSLTQEDIENNAATIHSIRLWDHEELLDALKQIQEIRTYYDFVSVDHDRYFLRDELQQFMLSGRELNSAGLPERNWINERLSYTHGYGLAVGPVNQMTSEGLPVLYVQDIPPVSKFPVFEIERPEIYFGELTEGYVVVKTGQKEFDYPSGEENVYSSYEGTGGVAVGSLFRKLLFAFYFRDAKIVLSSLITPESRFLYFRSVKQRFGRLAPFLLLDRDPYLVIDEGRIFWIQDAYTTSDRYPYSTSTPGVGNYMRNSVKMVMDAYNGGVEIYVADAQDPIIQVYQKIFPGIFRPLSEIPANLKSHLRYPQDIFTVQTYMYAVYHMGEPQIFYNKEDLWQIPSIGGRGNENQMSPYYVITRLPKEKKEEFILMLPFTPGRKDNLSAWMVARSDGEHYGRLAVYRFPKQKLVYGPRQIVARINQDAEISRQISLWDQRGSQVRQGNLLIIPMEEALLYIRPLYLRAESGKIPELKRVILAYENRIAMEETLEASIAKIFGDKSPQRDETREPIVVEGGTRDEALTADKGDLIRQAKEAYDRAVQAQREGDWARYGTELHRLGTVIDKLDRERDSQVPGNR